MLVRFSFNQYFMKQFYHSGAAGDIIFSIPTIQAMGGGNLVLGCNRKMYDALRPLLMRTTGIHSVRHANDADLDCGWIDLTMFRQDHYARTTHLVESHQIMQRISTNIPIKWLRVDESNFKNFIVINRTPRYQDKFFNWKKELKYLETLGEVIFLGN